MKFADLLSKKLEETEAVPNLPIGTYVCSIVDYDTGHVDDKKNGTGGWDSFNINMKIVQPTENVDEEALADFGPGIVGTKLQRRFMFSVDDERNYAITENQVKEFFEALDMPKTNSYGENVVAMKGMFCRVTVGHRANPENPARPYIDIKGVSAA